jgi:hypothetical protein
MLIRVNRDSIILTSLLNNFNTLKYIRIKKILAFGIPISVVVIGIILYLLFWSFYLSVKDISKIAQAEFGGDCVEALILYAESDKHNFKERNHAIWAIEQFGDERALPVLKKLYTGKPCILPCNTNDHICQYGLEKAIKFSKDGTLFSPLIRYLLL